MPDSRIEPGDKTDEPIRTRGWTHWHHLFTPRHLLIGALVRSEMTSSGTADLQLGAGLGLLSQPRLYVAADAVERGLHRQGRRSAIG